MSTPGFFLKSMIDHRQMKRIIGSHYYVQIARQICA